jgi:hypothetical protein
MAGGGVMSKIEMVRTLERVQSHFKLYGKTCATMADEAKPKSRKRADLNARAEVWHGAALEIEQAIAVLKASPAKFKKSK